MDPNNPQPQPQGTVETVIETVKTSPISAPTKTAWGAWRAPTPKFWIWVFRTALYIAAMVTAACTTFTDWSVLTKLHVAQYASYATIAVHLFCNQFGIVIDTNKQQQGDGN